jgi:hypothetical protein
MINLNGKLVNLNVNLFLLFFRSKTDETEYKDTHSERPSNEIQTTIDLLFKEKGLYGQDKMTKH